MRTIDEYMKLSYRMEIVADPDEGGFVVSFPDLKGCLSTGDTLDSAYANANEAKREWIAAALEDGYEIPEPSDMDAYSGQFKLRIPKSLHKRLAENSRREGISMNQYCNYLLTMNDAVHSSRKDKNKAV